MLNGKRIIVVMPAYNAEKTVEETFKGIPQDMIDHVILVDDSSSDATVSIANSLGVDTFVHPKNLGYGGNQKTCYQNALRAGGDVIIMLHPDYQYTPRLLVSLAAMVAYGQYDVALGSRMLLGGALKGGMPFYKYVSNRFLTWAQNQLMGTHLSEFHTGYRAFSRDVLLNLPLMENSDNFVFDNQILAQTIFFGYSIGEISCPTKYFEEASSISILPSIHYGFGVLRTAWQFFLQKRSWGNFRIFGRDGKRLLEVI